MRNSLIILILLLWTVALSVSGVKFGDDYSAVVTLFVGTVIAELLESRLPKKDYRDGRKVNHE